jgi:hypothetical protein
MQKRASVLELQSASLTLLGNFNPFIISPDWLKATGIWGPKDLHLSLGSTGGAGVQFYGDGTDWRITAERLVIASMDDDCGLLAEKILDALPHTPMVAVVFHFVFQAPTGATDTVFSAIRQAIEPATGAELLRWGTVFHRDNARIDVAFVTGSEGTTVSSSHRRAARTTSVAKDAVKNFSNDKHQASELVSQMIRAARP